MFIVCAVIATSCNLRLNVACGKELKLVTRKEVSVPCKVLKLSVNYFDC